MTLASRAASAIETDLDQLADRYSFDDEPAVTAFLRGHPDLATTLLDAADVIPRYFGAGRPAVLEVVRDPEARDHVQLFARIQTDLDVDTALERLRRFDDEWWLPALAAVGPALMFAIEYE